MLVKEKAQVVNQVRDMIKAHQEQQSQQIATNQVFKENFAVVMKVKEELEDELIHLKKEKDQLETELESLLGDASPLLKPMCQEIGATAETVIRRNRAMVLRALAS